MRRPLTVVTCLILLGVLLSDHFVKPKNEVLNLASREKFVCEGYLTDPIRETEFGTTKLRLKLLSCGDGSEMKNVEGVAQLTVNSDHLSFKYGEVVRFRSSFKLPTDFKNGGGFSFKNYCLANGISILGYIDDPNWIVSTNKNYGNFLRLFIESIRGRINRSLDPISDRDVRDIGRALIIGDGYRIREEVKEAFRLSGLSHVLVLSGMNVGFAALIFYFLSKWLLLRWCWLARRINVFKPAAVITIVGVWFYSYLAGGDVSIVRAAIMASVFLFGIVIDRRQDSITSLSFAALIIVVWNRFAIYDISFQLSFVAVLGIVIVYPRLMQLVFISDYMRNNRLLKYFAELFCLSFSAIISVAPLISYYFNFNSVSGLFANFIAVPYVGAIVTPLSLIAGFFGAAFPAISHVPVILFSYSIVPFLLFAEYMGKISETVQVAFTVNIFQIVLYYCFILLLLCGRKIRFFKSIIAVIVLFFFATILFQRGFFMEKKLNIFFPDVGQGSSVVVKFPNGKVMVVDGGGIKKSNFDIGKFVLAPFLWQNGITNVDYVVATHPHPDHFKGLSFIVKKFNPKMVIAELPDSDFDDKTEWEAFISLVRERKIEIKNPLEVGLIKEGDAFVNILLPFKGSKKMTENDSSIVMSVEYGKNKFLLTGDIEGEAEAELSRYGQKLKSDVLQVPHHGSNTSTSIEFLKLVAPKYAVIQAGENNRYGFPSKKVLGSLNSSGAQILRTDNDGFIEFEAGTESLKVFPEKVDEK